MRPWPTFLEDYQPGTTFSSLKCSFCFLVLLQSHKQVTTSDLPKDLVLREKIWPWYFTNNNKKCLNCKHLSENTPWLAQPLWMNRFIELTMDAQTNFGSFWWGRGKISSLWGIKHKWWSLLSWSHSWAALHHLHHSQKVTCEHMVAPAVLPSQGVACQLAFGPSELRVGWLTPQSCYRTFLPHPILLMPCGHVYL